MLPVKKIWKGFFAFFVVLCLSLLLAAPSSSDELDDISKQLNDLTNALNMSIKATKPLESQLTQLQSQITAIKNRVSSIEWDLALKKREIDKGYQDLAQKELLLNRTIRDYYIKSYYNSPLLLFVSSQNASEMTQLLAYQRAKTNQDKSIITTIALSITDLENKKVRLQAEQTRLIAIKTTLDTQESKLNTVITGAKAYQATLTGKIAQLSARQQQLLAQKLASLNIPTSAYTTKGGCTDDRNIDPGFSPRFALFTFGTPNRVGLNQYGAKGRAEAGQSAEQILSSYYNADLNKSYNTGINITVNGTNEYGQTFNNQTWNIEDYVKHIYEMPASWPMEALKAQAVAARSYALAQSQNGTNPICPSQSCQVVKQEINASSWQQAVDATRGWVLVSGNQPIKAWFSSTHGGYVHSSSDIGWSATPYTKTAQDTTQAVNSFTDLFNNAYDKSSPWFYCDWGARSSYSNTAWLKSDELADIINVLLLGKADPTTQKHLSQTDKPNPDGVDTWDANRVKSELSQRGITPFSNVASANVEWDKGTGVTTSITFTGDGGTKTFSGSEFKSFFNLRAPANINIVGPLYNVEKR